MTTWNALTTKTDESSYWLSDELCHALYNYNALVGAKQSEYESLLQEREQLLTDYSNKDAEIFNVKTDLQSVQDIIDIKQTQGQDANTELVKEKELKLQLHELSNQLEKIKEQLDNNDNTLNALVDSLSFENNFTVEQQNELSPFINTEIWENSNIFNEDDLIEASKEYFSKVNHPKNNMSINLIDLLQISDVKVKELLEKIEVMDKLNIHYEYFDINAQSQIIEIDLNYDSGSIGLTIANTKDIYGNPNDEIADMIYKNNSVAGSVRREKYKWDKIIDTDEKLNNFLQSALDAAKQEIIAGVNESVQINNRGITVYDSNDLLRYIRITNSVIGLVKDGDNLGVAISPEGIFKDKMVFSKVKRGDVS